MFNKIINAVKEIALGAVAVCGMGALVCGTIGASMMWAPVFGVVAIVVLIGVGSQS